ncbi:mechanosensitive ion channel family protein [Methanogenium sp. S4BF]|uniref:mechanosensitive ion channel family protein n=1 Tax=Methanogenium sp. S4BF TaxID=1789226 RepID=UPI002415C14B|nr:mechanosensitive ion channel family protein [Methanogenium sp. S4BF]WFN34505.1 mechanosensitive ion channel family protein [Methanogenium sp. S4BF]
MLEPDIPIPTINIYNVIENPIENITLAIITLILGSIIVYFIGKKISSYGVNSVRIPRLMMVHITNAIKFFLYLVVILIALAFLDEDIEAVIISVSALVTFILGFGMKDTINNMASGVWIASSRAYDIDDEVTIAGHHGYVTQMNMMATELRKVDNTRIIVPNGNAWNNPIVNVSKMPTRMIVMSYQVAYTTTISNAIEVALNAASKTRGIHAEPEPYVRFREISEYSITLQLRAWTDTDGYYPTESELKRTLFAELTNAGIQIPYPMMDVNVAQR